MTFSVFPRGKVYYAEMGIDGKVVKRSTGVPITEPKSKAKAKLRR